LINSLKKSSMVYFSTFNSTDLIRFLVLILVLFPVSALGQEKPVEVQDIPKLDIGGALRFNYNNSSWKPEQQARGGDFGP
jgi:hypothetical protein